MELHGTLGNIKPYGDFFVCEILKNAVENFSFSPADFYARSKRPPSGQQFLSALGRGVQERFAWNYHQLKIFGRLASYQAMNCQQAGDFLDRHAAIGISIHMETNRPRGALTQNKALGEKGRLQSLHINGLLSSSYQNSLTIFSPRRVGGLSQFMISMRYGKGHVQKHRRNFESRLRRARIVCVDEFALGTFARTNTIHAIGPGHPSCRNQITPSVMQIVYHIVEKVFPHNRKELGPASLQ